MGMLRRHAERSSWCVHKSSPCFYVFDPRANESLLDAAFSLNLLRISQNRTATKIPFLRFLTFIDQPLDSTRFVPSQSKSIEFIASCQRLSCLPPATVLPIWFHACSSKSWEVLSRKSVHKCLTPSWLTP